MLEIFFVIITFFFLILGIDLFVLKRNSKNHRLQKELRPAYSVLTVKNREDSIEGTVRSIAWQMQTNPETSKELVVLDLDSEDQTFLILKKLAKEYSFIHPMHRSEYIDFISKM